MVQPQPEVANNGASGVTLPSGDTTANAPAAAPSDAPAQPDCVFCSRPLRRSPLLPGAVR